MLLKSIIIFVICNYMRKVSNINMSKVYVNYKSLFIKRQCCIFMSLAQGSCAVAASSRENRSNNMSTLWSLINMMWCLLNMAAEGNINVKNLAQTMVQHLAFWESINSILTATNQEQLTYIVPVVSTEIPEREGSVSIQHL